MQKPSKYQDLLQRWLRGDTTRREERELERLAADDPFLAEALEGYRRRPEGAHPVILDRLRDRLEGAGGRRTGPVFYLFRIAAAIALLVVALGGFWWLNRPQAEPVAQEMKATELRPAPVSPGPSVADATEETTAATSAREEAAPQEEAEPTVSPPKPEPAAGSAAIPEKAPPSPPPAAYSDLAPAEPEKDLAESAPLPTPAEEADEAMTPRIAENARTVAPAADAPPSPTPEQIELGEDRTLSLRRSQAPPRILTGRIIDGENNEPMIGANILVKGTSAGAVTDFDGEFRLELPAGADQLLISYTGYLNQEFALSPADSFLTFRLEPAGAVLSEVVVTGLSRKEKQSAAASTDPSPTAPTPRGGFDKFEDYLRKKREYPAQALENGITGTVLLEFTVDEKGRPGNVRVLQSLGYGCDEEAIRLIEEGPRWKDAGPGERIRYAVRFD